MLRIPITSARTATHRYSSRWTAAATSSPSSNIGIRSLSTLKRLEDANPERIRGIQVNPESMASQILPGNMVYKKYKWSGNVRKIPLELVHGYFWMMRDLERTGKKPILSNEQMIAAEDAQVFPILKGVKSLAGKLVDLPFYFTEESTADCTLLSISFRDSGFKDIPSWTQPFEQAMKGYSNVESLKLSITERWSLYPLQGVLTRVMKQNTPVEAHESTFVYFGTNVDDLVDVLRMHNLMANYVYLVDSAGRIRFAGSGPATEEDLAKMIGFAKDLAEGRRKTTKSAKKTAHKKGIAMGTVRVCKK